MGYVFSMAVGTNEEWLKLVPFFVRGQTVDYEGRGGGVGIFLKINGGKTPKKKVFGRGP